MQNIAIVLAAGESKRMKNKIKKQFLLIENKKLYIYSLEKFVKNNNFKKVILVLDENNFSKEIQYISNCKFFTNTQKEKIIFVTGGKERFDSVYNALFTIKEFVDNKKDLKVFIHDSARMYINEKDISSCINAIKKYKAITLAKKCTDTIKEVNKNTVVQTLDRSKLYAIQTPQCFDFKLISKVYNQFYLDINLNKIDSKSITDDCMLIEKYSKEKVRIVESKFLNDKITYIEDLKK